MKTEVIKLDPQYPDLGRLMYCAKIIRQGGLVIFPTETVYGVGADLSNPKAMKRLREVKKRSDGKPFSVLIAQRGLISNYTSMNDTRLYKLIDSFWPGPLTIIVPGLEEEKTIGVRMPDNTIALRLVQESQCAFAAPSANCQGNPPPLTCAEALRDMDGLVEVAIDGGAANLGVSSTVVDITQPEPKILREGLITSDNIGRTIKKKTILFVCTGNSCRSVMADYLLKHYLKNRADVEVLSAGTGVFIQSTASRETLSVLREEGIDALGHISQPVNSILLKKADLIFVMTQMHRQNILERAPTIEKRVYLLKEFANVPTGYSADFDIPDPIGKSHDAYKECLGVIKEAVKKIVELV